MTNGYSGTFAYQLKCPCHTVRGAIDVTWFLPQCRDKSVMMLLLKGAMREWCSEDFEWVHWPVVYVACSCGVLRHVRRFASMCCMFEFTVINHGSPYEQ